MSPPSEILDSALSTRTLVLVRTTARGVWRTALILFLAFVLWLLLQRGGAIEQALSLPWRWQLERWRVLLGPVLLLPIFISALQPLFLFWRSPLVPGKRILFAVLVLAVGLLGILAPYHVWARQLEDERLCREVHLPLAWQLWQQKSVPEVRPACPVQWEAQLGDYVLVDRDDLFLADPFPWHPHGAWGITRQGKVIRLDSPASETPAR